MFKRKYWSVNRKDTQKRHRKIHKGNDTRKDTEQPQHTNQYLSWPLGGPAKMGAASAACCALSAGSKPIEEVLKDIHVYISWYTYILHISDEGRTWP